MACFSHLFDPSQAASSRSIFLMPFVQGNLGFLYRAPQNLSSLLPLPGPKEALKFFMYMLLRHLTSSTKICLSVSHVLLHNRLSKFSGLKQETLCHSFQGQESRCNLAESSSSVSVMGIQIMCQRTATISRLEYGRALFPAHFHGWWQDSVPGRLLDSGPQFLTGCWQLTIWQFSERVSEKSQRENTSKTEVTILYDSISEVTFHPFTNILLIISSTLKGRGLHMSMNKEWQESLGHILEAAELNVHKDA